MEPEARRILVDTAAIPGWGVDAEPRNDPTWPMRDRARDDSPGRNWVRPTPQASDVEILTSIEYPERPAVFGTSTPPSGLSGQIRRTAFRFSESRWSHWLLLLLADRINMVEGVLADLGRGRLPNLVDEFGVKARLSPPRPAVIKGGATLAVAGAVVGLGYLLLRPKPVA